MLRLLKARAYTNDSGADLYNESEAEAPEDRDKGRRSQSID
jgi:hypothetical protein